MKSIQVQRADPKNAKNYSDLQVLKSAAGYYVGTIHNDPSGFQEPGSRDTTYFPTKEIAEEVLAKLIHFYEKENEFWLESFDAWIHDKGYDPDCVGYRFNP